MKKKLLKTAFFNVTLLASLFVFFMAGPASALPFPNPYIEMVPSGTGPGAPNSWSFPNTKFVTAGEFETNPVFDPSDDLAAIYDYGNNNMGIICFLNGQAEWPKLKYLSGPGNWSVTNTKFVTSGDYNNDGKDDIAMIYNYGNNNMGIWVFYSGSTPNRLFLSGPGNWGVANTKFVISGDYNNDDKDDIAMMYDYGNNNMGIWVFTSSGSGFAPSRQYLSGPGNWGVANTKFVTSGNYHFDSYADIAAVYNYGNNDMGIWVFSSNGSTLSPSRWYKSGPGNWGVANTKFVTTSLGVELAMMYDYGNSDMSIWTFLPFVDGTFTPQLSYRSGAGNWSVANTKSFNGGFFDNGYSPFAITSLYDYGNGRIGSWEFDYKLPMGPG